MLPSVTGSVGTPVDAESHSQKGAGSETVAERPRRLGLHLVMRSMVSRQHSNCNPLSELMNACTSSMITNLSEANIGIS